MLVHNDRIALGGVRGDKFIFGAIRGDKQLFDTSVITDANKEYILATYGEEALAKALVYLHGNPSFIPFFNEDPDTICSVCEIGWFRGIRTDIINIDVYPTKHTIYDILYIPDEITGNNVAIFGISSGGSIGLYSYSLSYRGHNELLFVNQTLIGAIAVNIPYHIEMNHKSVSLTRLDTNATSVYSTKIVDTYVYPNTKLSINGATGSLYAVKSPFAKFLVKENGKVIRHLIPFKSNGGTYFMLDMTNYKKYEAGTYSDQEKKIKL